MSDASETVQPTDTVTVEIPESTVFAFGSKGSADPVEKIVEQIKQIHALNGWVPA